ncbi:MAG TPA: hypothetical protein VII33_01850, partial [Nakamurella sp.]
MTTATKPARPRSAHNGVEHTAVLDTAVQHDGAAATDAAFARIVAAALRETTMVAGELIAQTAVAL